MTDEPVAPIDPPEPVPYDGGDPAQVKDKRKRAKRVEEQRLAALRGLMSIPEGRRLVWWHLGLCQIFMSSFRADPYLTAFNEGARNVGLTWLADIMKAAPDEYLTMTKEAKGPEDV
jgi:hypothetical protein